MSMYLKKEKFIFASKNFFIEMSQVTACILLKKKIFVGVL